MSDAVPDRAAAGRRRVRADRRAQSLDTLPVLFVLVALTAGALAAVYLLVEDGPAGVTMAALSALVALGSGLARAMVGRRPFRDLLHAHPHEVNLATWVAVSLVPFADLWLLERTVTAGGVVVLLLAVGSLTNDRNYAAAVTLVFLLEWFVVAGRNGFAQEWAPLSALVVCAAVLASVLNGMRCRAADHLAGAQHAVQAVSLTDELTGLANRRGLLRAATDLVADGAPGDPLSVLFLDLDGLKRVNDRFGHAAGDRLVLAAGAALGAATRSGDVVARLGGDEFAVLLPGATVEQAEVAGHRVREVLADFGVAASVGIAHGARGDGLERLLSAADASMYRAKEHRRAAPVPRPQDGRHLGAPPSTAPGNAAAPSAAPSAGPPPSSRRTPPARTATHDLDEPSATAPMDLHDLCRAGVWLHLVVAPVHMLLLPAGQGRTMAAVSLLLAGGFATLYLVSRAARTLGAVQRHAGALLCLALLALSAETVVYSHVVMAPWASLAVLLAVVAVGGAVPSRLQATLVGLATVLVWGRVNPPAALGEAAPWYAVSVACAVSVAVLLHVTRGRTMARLGAAQQQVRLVALTDELTGLPNRRGFLVAGRAGLEAAVRRAEPAAVLLLDLDGLKQTNDSAGHAAGDRLIGAAATVVRECGGPRAVCARYGGDEFTVLVPGAGPEQSGGLALRLEAALAVRSVRASIGVSHLPGDGTTVEELLARADERMFRVKKERRGLRPEVVGPRTGC